jgi:hypothetical protein
MTSPTIVAYKNFKKEKKFCPRKSEKTAFFRAKNLRVNT